MELESRDPIASAKWYRRAANQGSAQAQTELGDMYAAGLGVPQNLAEAARWYRAAAEQRSLESWPAGKAESSLGYMYAVGEGVPQDFAEAAKLFRMAAERHHWCRENESNFRGYEERIHFLPAVDAAERAWLCEAAERGWALVPGIRAE